MSEDAYFARLVSLACHDLRTPLATVQGFAKTLVRIDPTPEQTERYLGMIDAASSELVQLLDALALAARLESGRYDPVLREADTLELAEAAAVRTGLGERISSVGTGATVRVDVDAIERALAALAVCALRHGGVPEVVVQADGTQISIAPVVPEAEAIVLGDDLKDMGAAVAVRLVRVLGGTVELDGEHLRLTLPA